MTPRTDGTCALATPTPAVIEARSWYKRAAFGALFPKRMAWGRYLETVDPLCVRKLNRGRQTWLEVRDDAPYKGRPIRERAIGRLRLSRAALAGTGKERERELAAAELLRRDREFQRLHPQSAPTTNRYFKEFQRVHGGWADEHGLSCGRGAMLRLRKRAGTPGCALFDYGNCGSHKKPRPAELLENCRETLLHANKFSRPAAIARQRIEAEKLGIEPLTTWQVREFDETLPRVAKVLGRKGPEAMRRESLPHVQISYDHLAAGEWICCDGSDADAPCRIPDGNEWWKRARVVWNGGACLSSTKIICEFSLSEHTTALARLLRRILVEWGRPRDVSKDQGKAFCKAFGSAGAQVFDTMMSRLGVTVHEVTPRTPEAKRIESLWRLVRKEMCDRLHPVFTGGSPQERSHTAEKAIKDDILELPTFDEYCEHGRLAIERWNATPRKVLGGLSPNQAFEQRRSEDSRINAEAAKLLCIPTEGERLVRRDGVSVGGIVFRPDVEDLVKLQGKKVRIGRDLDEAGVLWLFDKNDKPICRAFQARWVQMGISSEQQRATMRDKAKMTAIAKKAQPARDFLRETPVRQVLKQAAAAAKSEEAARAATLPPAPEVPRVLVAQEFSGAAKAIRDTEKRRDVRRLARVGVRVEPADEDDFDILSTPMHNSQAEAEAEAEAAAAKLADDDDFDLLSVPWNDAAEEAPRTSAEEDDSTESEYPADLLRRTARAG